MWVDRETAAICRYIRQNTRRARSQGQGQIVLDVGEICLRTYSDSPNRFSRCCEVLDSDILASEVGLRFRGRVGVWGTANAQYIFLIVTPKAKIRNRIIRVVAPALVIGIALVTVLTFVLLR